MPNIELTTIINAPIERCFDLARSIDLHKLSTADTDEEAIAGVTTGLIGKGQRVTWRAKHFGIRQTLTSEITEFKYPYHFRDVMVQGAFKMINHDHIFQQVASHTVMTDKFYFESPGGILGRIFNKLVLTNYLKNILITRNRIIKEVAEGNQWREIL
jgi:ligand-binding SRPBCC domain-containing protein